MTNYAFRWMLSAALAAVIGTCCAGCKKSHGAVSAAGSTSIQPFAEMLAEEFNKTHPAQQVEVQGGGSAQGLTMAASGVADIGMCSRELKDDEKPHYKFMAIAYDGLAVIVNLDNPVTSLTHQQVQEIFDGNLTRWSEVGGYENHRIRLITREEGSGTREAFSKMVMGKARISRKALTQESNGAVKELVAHDPDAIGYMSLGLVGKEAKILDIDGVKPSIQTVTSKQYPLVRPFLFVWTHGPNAAAQAYVDFVLSPPGQQMLQREGLVPVSGMQAGGGRK